MLTKLGIMLSSAVLTCAVLLSGCTGTKLVSVWKDDTHQGHAAKTFVIGIVKEQGPRSLIEDEVVKQLQARGNTAMTSYPVLPSDPKPSKETVIAKIKEAGADTILVVRFLKKDIGSSHTPLRRYGVPQGFDTSWDGYYGYGGAATEYAVRDVSYDFDVVSMETTLFDVATQKPLWSALSETKYQGGILKQIKPYVSTIVKKLAKEKLIR